MTANRRIFLNIFATYMRSAYTLALGLLTARWLLAALGQTDYGLFGVVGGLIAFVTFFNTLLSGAVSRYYAVAVGFARTEGNAERGLAECRRWFTAAVTLHTVVPLVLVAIGEPLGELAVRSVLVIPPDRLAPCLWVWRCACLTAFVGMANVPLRAMYIARQEIAEMTVYTFLEATSNAALLLWMVAHPGDWLARYAFGHCLIVMMPKILMGVRAFLAFPECRIRLDCLACGRDIRELAAFAGWNAFEAAGQLLRVQGAQILINRLLGPVQNASMTLASRLSERANVFSASIVAALSPAVAGAWGAGTRDRMAALADCASKFSALLSVMVVVPLVLEAKEVLLLWLKTPPEGAAFLCVSIALGIVPAKMTEGSHLAIVASGRVAGYQLCSGLVQVGLLVAIAVLMFAGFGLAAVGGVLLASGAATAVVRVVFARRAVDFPPRRWLTRIALPIVAATTVAAVCGVVPRTLVAPSFWRVVLTVLAVESVLLPFSWWIVFSDEEREYVRNRLSRLARRRR